MNLSEILSMNLKYYRMKYHLSQERFSEVLGTSLSYLNQIENKKVDVRMSTVDKFARNISLYDEKSNINPEYLLTYKKEHITNYPRIDSRKIVRNK